MKIFIVTALLGLIVTPSFARTPAGLDINAIAEESKPAAMASLATLEKLVTEESAPRMGFTGPGEVGISQLDTPLTGFMVRLDSLREYQQGENTMSLLNATGLIIYPVKTGSSVRSSVTLKKKGSEWKAVSFGSPILTKALDRARKTVGTRDSRKISEFFEVRIPAFNLIFVGHVVGEKLMLTSVADMDVFGFKATETRPAEEFFLRLKPEAERHKGLPR